MLFHISSWIESKLKAVGDVLLGGEGGSWEKKEKELINMDSNVVIAKLRVVGGDGRGYNK